MERLTNRVNDVVVYTKGKYEIGTLPIEMESWEAREVLYKLAAYEDAEEQLESVYGECDGLLQKAIEHLVKHEGAEIGQPYKARLLTDEDVDKWLEYKQLEEQGLLLRLPCKVGDTVYFIYHGLVCKSEVRRFYQCNGAKNWGIVLWDTYPDLYFDQFGKTVFLTKEEAEKALQDLKEGAV